MPTTLVDKLLAGAILLAACTIPVMIVLWIYLDNPLFIAIALVLLAVFMAG